MMRKFAGFFALVMVVFAPSTAQAMQLTEVKGRAFANQNQVQLSATAQRTSSSQIQLKIVAETDGAQQLRSSSILGWREYSQRSEDRYVSVLSAPMLKGRRYCEEERFLLYREGPRGTESREQKREICFRLGKR